MFCILARLDPLAINHFARQVISYRWPSIWVALRLLGSAVDVLAHTGIHGVPYPLSVPWFDVANSIAVLS